MDWIRKLFGWHVHSWAHYKSYSINPQNYMSGGIEVRVMGRTIHYRECADCAKVEQYYP